MQKTMSGKTKELYGFDRMLAAEFLCGVDEAGRGPLAGPVVCAAVIMPPSSCIDGVNDSKQLTEKQRERLAELIKKEAVAYKISVIDNLVIDEINILEATKRGMEEAILGLSVRPDMILVDAVKGLKIGREYRAVIKGDGTSYAIACASVLAKTARDDIMREAAKQFPDYGFVTNKGYGTAGHISALKRIGKTPIHRDSFIKNFVEGGESEDEKRESC